MLKQDRWGSLRTALAGGIVGALLVMAVPVMAGVGDPLKLGQANSANAVTRLSGRAATNLLINNTKAGAPAADLRVAPGSAPLRVNSRTRVKNLNADLLDNRTGNFYAPAYRLPVAEFCGRSGGTPPGVGEECEMQITARRAGTLLMSGSGGAEGDGLMNCRFEVDGKKVPNSQQVILLEETTDFDDRVVCSSNVGLDVSPGQHTVKFVIDPTAEVGGSDFSAFVLLLTD
jgi:hypothetical protein